MKTITDKLIEAKEGLSHNLTSLMRKYSSLRNTNEKNSPIVLIGPSFRWKDLSLDGHRLQSKLIQDFIHFFSLVNVLLQDQSETIRKKTEEDGKDIREIIEQNYLSWYKTPEEALSSTLSKLEEMIDSIQHLYDPTEGDVLLIPDTNALIYNPVLEDWNFPNFSSFTLILVPSVLTELDSHKVNHRNQEVRNKAESLIRRIKEYRRRGSLSDGVPLKKCVSSIQAFAIEPHMHDTLPWFDPTNPDDRILSSVLEITRLYPRSIVIAITRDINFQNKAEFARIPFLEPPEPVKKEWP